MYQKKLPVTMECGMHLFMEVMNGKWKLDLIWNIYQGLKRPGELQRKIDKATRRVLDTQLKQLCEHGLVSKTIFNELPYKVEYELTELGKSLLPVIVTIAGWGEENRNVLEGTIKGLL